MSVGWYVCNPQLVQPVTSKIEKVPRGIRGEKSSKDMASSRNLVNWSISRSQNGGRNQMSGRVSVPCWHATPIANAPWKPLIIGEGQAQCQGHEIGGKSDWLGSHCWSRSEYHLTFVRGILHIAE